MGTSTLDLPVIPTSRPAPILDVAADILERGWLQHGWYVREPTTLLRRLRFGPPRPDEVRSACLVAAITVAAHRGSFLVHVERDALPWLDLVWRELHPGRSPRGLAPATRIRDLVMWNDRPERTRHDVIAVVRAAALSRDHDPAGRIGLPPGAGAE